MGTRNYRGGNGADRLHAGHATHKSIISGGGGNDDLNAGHTTWESWIYGGDGNDVIGNYNKALNQIYIWDGAGDDYVNVGAVNVNIYASSGNDTYKVTSGSNVYIELGTGEKDVTVNYVGSKATLVEKGYWYDRDINVKSANTSVTTGYGNDTVYAFGLFSCKVESWGGNNNIIAEGAGVNVKTGSGHDTITSSAVSSYIHSGDGDDWIVSKGASVKAHTGWNGNNYVYAGGAHADIWTGNGHDEIDARGIYAKIRTEGGDDIININAVGATVNAGSGNNDLYIRAAGANITAGNGNDYAYGRGRCWVSGPRTR